MKLWWLSFADPNKGNFLGASIVRAHDFTGAIKVSHALGCNPGGECMGKDIPEDMCSGIDESHIERLLTVEECMEVDKMMGGEGKVRKEVKACRSSS